MAEAPAPAPVTDVSPAQPFFTAWQLVLIAVTVAITVGGLAWVVGQIKGRDQAVVGPDADKEGPKPPSPGPTALPPEKKKGDGNPTGPKLKVSPIVLPRTEVKGDDTVGPLRTALGTFTGVNLRQAFLNIGLLADGVEGGIYEVDDALKILTTVEELLDTAEKQLRQLPEKAFEAEDREQVEMARKALLLLRAEAKELRAYWADDTKEAAARFQKARAAAWAAIKELLELDD
jgi:hypothetical protein